MYGPNSRSIHTAVIGLGSNIQPEVHLLQAAQRLSEHVEICEVSQIYQNPAQGSDGPDYLNAALLIRTALSKLELKEKILCRIEEDLDRQRSKDKNADRTIDLDILCFDGLCLDEELWSRAHVSVPAAEVAPHLQNPSNGEKIQEAAHRLLPDQGFFPRDDLHLPVSSD